MIAMMTQLPLFFGDLVNLSPDSSLLDGAAVPGSDRLALFLVIGVCVAACLVIAVLLITKAIKKNKEK